MTALDEIRNEVREFDAEGAEPWEEMAWPLSTMRRLLDELDTDRPTWLDEVAARIASGIAATPWSGEMIDKEIARSAYDAAEALIVEGKRRRASNGD